MKLAMYEQRVGREKAEKYVLSLSKKIGLPIESRHDLDREVEYLLGGKKLLVCFPAEIQHVMRHGKANVLQQLRDSEDRYLNTPFSLGVLSGVSGLKVNISSSYGTHEVSLKSPGLIEAPEVSFSNEIIRNSIVHPTQPTIPYSVSEVVKYLNYAQDGIGGLLTELRRFSGQSEDIGFIRQIKTEPEIRILKAV